eukprot:symbB.v1.2.000161.t2/scaffold9.1/size550961/17
MLKDLTSTEQVERGIAFNWLKAWLQMPMQLFMPSLGMLTTLLVLNLAVSAVPMAEELISTAVPGLVVILLLGPTLFIPAILMGDWMAEAREEREEPAIPAWLLPKELLWRPLSKDQRRRRRRYALFGILSYDHRAACPFLMLIVIILLIITLTSVQEPLSVSTPPLFGDGELFRDGQAAKALLGPLPSPEHMAETSLRNATACRIDADLDVECSWFSCTGDKEADLPEDSCTCDFRLPYNPGSTCHAEALFSGTDTVPENFWAWAQQQFSMTFLGNATSKEEPPLEVEEWSSGQNLLQKQVSSSIPIQLLGVSCFRAICYCGARRCVRSTAWQDFGVMPISTPTTTTLPNDTVSTTDVFIVWGLKQQTSMVSSDLQWISTPEMWATPQALAYLQRSLGISLQHLDLHGCAIVQGALSLDMCQRMKEFVDDELLRVQRSLENADETERCLLEQRSLGSVRNREQRWKTACAPLLTVFVALQDIQEAMGPTQVFPGTHDDPYLQQWLSVMPGAERTPEQFGGGQMATCSSGTALLMNSRLLHCGGANLRDGARRRLFYMTWQKAGNTNHGSTYSIHHTLAGRWRMRDVLANFVEPHDLNEERIELELLAKKKDDPQAMLDFALRLRQEKDPGAVEWLRATGRKGHPLACMHLAEMYCLGELGLETNFEAAEELRRFAFGNLSQNIEFVAQKPLVEIISRKCFALDFQQWLEARGERFPVEEANFSQHLETFANDLGREKYFWRSPITGLAGTVAQLRVLKDASLSHEELISDWQRYLSLRRMAPWRSRAWLASTDTSLEVKELQMVEAATAQVALIFVAMLALWTCLFTCSMRMALAAACSGGFCILTYVICRPLGPESAVLQLLCLLLLVAAAVAPLTRFIFFYSSARNGPGKRVKNEKSHSFEIEDTVELPSTRESNSVRQESIPRSQTQRLLSVETELTAQLKKEREDQRRLAQVAAERKEMQSLFRPSAIHSERRNRSTTALCHSAEIILGFVVSTIFSWLTLWLAAPEALSQVGRIFPVLSVILLVVILCVFPILILAGLGASRVWRQAFLAYVGAITGWNRRFGGPACSFPELRTPQDDELEISRSIKVLGWPFNRYAERRRTEISTGSISVTKAAELDR